MKMKRYLCAMLVSLALVGQASAQDERPKKGVWMSFEPINIGATLNKPLGVGGKSMTFEASIGIGYHINPKWSASLGLMADGYNRPWVESDGGIYLGVRHRPLEGDWSPLNIEGRWRVLNLRGWGENIKSQTHLSLSVGWDFRRVLGRIGVMPAIGVSWKPFSYSFDEDSSVWKRAGIPIFKQEQDIEESRSYSGKSSQLGVFFRVGILIN